MSLVVCRLPKTGLGNQLFPLMKAYVYAHLNNLPVIVTGYHQIKIGPYLRGEKVKRKYNNYFLFQKNILAEQLDKWKTKPAHFKQVVKEPDLNISAEASTLYEFSAIPQWNNYFDGLKAHRKLVRKLLYEIIDGRIKMQVEEVPAPVIGVHVRMGDFRKLAQQEDFSKTGAVRTPEPYFSEVIKAIRKVNGSELPVALFTDGYRHEFDILFSLPDVQMMEGNKDIVDLLLLSKSKVIVTSAGSTFSYWAGFLSDVPIILHPDHIHNTIRESNSESALYEGAFDAQQKKLTDSISKIKYEKSN
jgi:hypothetical protein